MKAFQIAPSVAERGEKVDGFYNNMGLLNKAHQLIIVPTTCGTGSEVSNISIISRTTKGVKQGIISPYMFSDQAALIPGMLTILPYGVHATSSIDAMIHAVESFLSPNACPLSEIFSEQALALILPCWKAAAESGEKDGWEK